MKIGSYIILVALIITSLTGLFAKVRTDNNFINMDFFQTSY
jgi:hypothetical protein